MNWLTITVWILLAFVAGSLPLSLWLGKIALRVDIRRYGDGNPGAANVWRAGGPILGITAVLLDGFKGAIPVAIANYAAGLDGWPLAAVAIAPIAGHAFSPFLGFHGGKALAVSFGIWLGISSWVGPTFLGVFCGIYLAILKPEGWAVMAGTLSFLIVLLFFGNQVWLLVWIGMALILAWKHREDLRQRPFFRRSG